MIINTDFDNGYKVIVWLKEEEFLQLKEEDISLREGGDGLLYSPKGDFRKFVSEYSKITFFITDLEEYKEFRDSMKEEGRNPVVVDNHYNGFNSKWTNPCFEQEKGSNYFGVVAQA